MKTSELTGIALDWAVAKCEGLEMDGFYGPFEGTWELSDYPYSTDWAHGGPITDREGFHRIVRNLSNGYTVSKKLVVLTDDDEVIRWVHGVGPTILIAAMRCYVASKLGDNVELPEGLA
tara:strand:- start:54 stop:410 length:357 start_codon:yes stop_codon:yes gene_type:complete